MPKSELQQKVLYS